MTTPVREAEIVQPSQVKLSQDLLDRRDLMRQFLGDAYEEKIASYVELIARLVERTGKRALSVGLELANRAYLDGQDQAANLILAATVELVEGGA